MATTPSTPDDKTQGPRATPPPLDDPKSSVVRYAEAEIPSLNGPVRLVVYRERANPEKEHVALLYKDALARPADTLVRVHSECLTSEVFGSTKCDCREQLQAAIDKAIEHEGGVILYLRQEGRGIGLGNKIRAYALQAEGLDTVAANHQLGFEADLRRYDVAADMLRDLGVSGVSLMTNNPRKLAGLTDNGIAINGRVSIEMTPSLHNAKYLATKRVRLGHMLELPGRDAAKTDGRE
jgi:GTP cyclohydrolase II